MEPAVNGIKSYPMLLAEAMERLARDVANYDLEDPCNVEYIVEKAESITAALNRWQ